MVYGKMTIETNGELIKREFELNNHKITRYNEKIATLRPVINNTSILNEVKEKDKNKQIVEIYNIILKKGKKIDSIIQGDMIIDVYDYNKNIAYDYYYNKGFMKFRNMYNKEYKKINIIK